jgi:hypothetical protein
MYGGITIIYVDSLIVEIAPQQHTVRVLGNVMWREKNITFSGSGFYFKGVHNILE